MNATATTAILSAIETLALSKAVKEAAEKEARKGAAVGEHTVDMTVRVVGSIKVGEDYVQNIVAKAQPWALLAVALSKLNGVTIDAITREAEAIAAGEVEAVKENAEKAIAAIKNTTTSVCKGKVTTKLAVERV